MCHLLVSRILHLIQPVVLVEPTALRLADSLVLLISELVAQLPHPLVLIKQALIVFHVPIQLHILLVKLDLALLQLLRQ